MLIIKEDSLEEILSILECSEKIKIIIIILKIIRIYHPEIIIKINLNNKYRNNVFNNRYNNKYNNKRYYNNKRFNDIRKFNLNRYNNNNINKNTIHKVIRLLPKLINNNRNQENRPFAQNF